ncbi:MAG TPA: NUDIX hydrolase [Actinokineospora sp.]|nr:NUDIX hydrolase [Actinokineospora sp.]
MQIRPGFGERHPDLTALLRVNTPAASADTSWADGMIPLRVSAFTVPVDLPDELVSSVRCLVGVSDRIVLCENRDGAHPWPGGRREPGETFADTAVREVHEETGWFVDRASLRPLGWLHYAHRSPRRADDVHPYPDFLQVVFHATAADRDGDGHWVDTDGFEDSSRLVTIEEAKSIIVDSAVPAAFLDLIA